MREIEIYCRWQGKFEKLQSTYGKKKSVELASQPIFGKVKIELLKIELVQ